MSSPRRRVTFRFLSFSKNFSLTLDTSIVSSRRTLDRWILVPGGKWETFWILLRRNSIVCTLCLLGGRIRPVRKDSYRSVPSLVVDRHIHDGSAQHTRARRRSSRRGTIMSQAGHLLRSKNTWKREMRITFKFVHYCYYHKYRYR